MFAERDRAVRFEQRIAAERARAQPVLGLEPGQRQPLFLELSAAVGERVGQGAPIGAAGGGDDPRITIELRRRDRAIDMTPLLG